MAPSDTGVRSPAISYVRGRQIRLDFVNRKVALVSVRDSVAGLYLEPQDSAKAAKATKPSSGKSSSVKAPAGKSPAAKPPSGPVRKPPAPSESSIKKPEAVGS
jgi:hypothetical protein